MDHNYKEIGDYKALKMSTVSRLFGYAGAILFGLVVRTYSVRGDLIGEKCLNPLCKRYIKCRTGSETRRRLGGSHVVLRLATFAIYTHS